MKKMILTKMAFWLIGKIDYDALIGLTINALQRLAKRTPTSLDDELLRRVIDAINRRGKPKI